MRKGMLISLLLISIFFCYGVKASSFDSIITSSISKIENGDSFTISVGVKNANELLAASFKLEYDTDKLELVSAVSKNDYELDLDDYIMADKETGKSGDFVICEIVFKAKKGFVSGVTVIKLSDVTGSSGLESFTGSNSSISIQMLSNDADLKDITINKVSIVDFKSDLLSYTLPNTDSTSILIGASKSSDNATISGIGTKPLGYGVNNYSITVTAENGDKKIYNLIITRNDTRNSDNYLSYLNVDVGSIKFDKDILLYGITLEHEINSMIISAKANDNKAVINGTGVKKLTDYVNKFEVTVTAENGLKRVYTILANRKDSTGKLGVLSNDNYLKSLEVEGYDIGFKKDTLEYQIDVSYDILKLGIKTVANSSKAMININNMELAVGKNTIPIDVVAEDGSIRVYKIIANRLKDIPTTKMDKIDEYLGLNNDEIIVKLDDNSKISNELVNKIKNSKKIVYFASDNYTWILDGTKIEEAIGFDSLITLDDSLKEKANYYDGIYLNFSHDGVLPSGLSLKINAFKYVDGSLLNVYLIKENGLELVNREVEVKDGFIQYDIFSCSDYVITKALVHDTTYIYVIIIIMEMVAIIGLFVYIMLRFKGKKLIH